MSPPLQFPLVIAIGFEPREADEIALSQMCQAREIKGAKGEPQFTTAQKLARQRGPAVFGQLVSAHILVRQIRRGLHRLRGCD